MEPLVYTHIRVFRFKHIRAHGAPLIQMIQFTKTSSILRINMLHNTNETYFMSNKSRVQFQTNRMCTDGLLQNNVGQRSKVYHLQLYLAC